MFYVQSTFIKQTHIHTHIHTHGHTHTDTNVNSIPNSSIGSFHPSGKRSVEK